MRRWKSLRREESVCGEEPLCGKKSLRSQEKVGRPGGGLPLLGEGRHSSPSPALAEFYLTASTKDSPATIVGKAKGHCEADIGRCPQNEKKARTLMSRGNKLHRQQRREQYKAKKRGPIAIFVVASLAVAAIIAAVVLYSPPGYSSIDVIGKEPTIVQVFLPG